MVAGTDLYTFYQENLLMVRYGFDLEAVMDMIPYEKAIYIGIIREASKTKD